MIETVASLVLLGLLMVAIGRVSTVKIHDQEKVDMQYSVLAVDAYLSDMYHDFRRAISYEYTESPAGQQMLTFVRSDGTPVIYSYSPTATACYKDGVRQFDAQGFQVTCAVNNLVVSVKLPNERLFEINVCR